MLIEKNKHKQKIKACFSSFSFSLGTYIYVLKARACVYV